MPYNGSGVYSTPGTPTHPAVAGELIRASYYNAVIADIAAALSEVVHRGGQTTLTADIPMASFKLTGLGQGTANGQAVRTEDAKKGSYAFYTGSSAGALGNAYTLTSSLGAAAASYTSGMIIAFFADSSATAVGVTVNVDGLGVVDLFLRPNLSVPAGYFNNNEPIVAIYNIGNAGFIKVSSFQKDFSNDWATNQAYAPGVLNPAGWSAVTRGMYTYTFGAAGITLTAPTTPRAGLALTIIFKQDATGGRTITYNSIFKFPAGADKQPASGANEISTLSMLYDAVSTIWLCNMVKDYE